MFLSQGGRYISQQHIINFREKWEGEPKVCQHEEQTKSYEENTNSPDHKLHTIYFFQLTTLYPVFTSYTGSTW